MSSREHILTHAVCMYSGWQQFCAGLGQHSVEEILATAELPAELARQEHAELTREQFFRLWNTMLHRRSLRELADWFLGFLHKAPPTPILAALCSRDLRSGLARLGEYKKILAPKQMYLEPCNAGLTVVCDWQASDTPGSLYFVELCAVQAFAEQGTGRKVTPLRAECPGAENIPDSLALELLGIPVVTGPLMKITFAEADLDEPFSMANTFTLQVLEDGLQEKLRSVSQNWSERLKSTLKHLLPDQRHTIGEAAEVMSCAPRTLQRQLESEGTSFKQVLNETRRELAIFYLSKMRFSPKETSFMLGYSEPSAFYNAFRKWNDRSPVAFQKSTVVQL